jgi:hypothetical protein
MVLVHNLGISGYILDKIMCIGINSLACLLVYSVRVQEGHIIDPSGPTCFCLHLHKQEMINSYMYPMLLDTV